MPKLSNTPTPPPLTSLLTRWRGFDPNVRRQLLTAGLMGFTLDGGINTVILNLYMLRLGFGPGLVGQVNAVGMLTFALVCLPAGRLGERWNLRTIMLAGILLCLAGTAMIPLTDALPQPWQAIWLMLASAVLNIGLAGYYVNAVPYMVTLTKPELRTSAFSVQSVFYASFGFAGSLIGGTLPGWIAELTGDKLTQPAPYRSTLVLVPLVMLLCLRLVWLMREVKLGDSTSAPKLSETAEGNSNHQTLAGKQEKVISAFALIALMAVIRFLQVGGVGAATTFFNVYLDNYLHVATANIGLIQALAKFVGIPIALLIPWLTRRLGNGQTVLLASGLVVVAMLPLALVPIWWIAGLGYIGVWAVTPVRYAAFMVYVMERSPERLRSSMNGAQELAGGLSFTLIALGGGYLIATVGYATLFVIGALLTAIGTLLFWLYQRHMAKN